MKKNKKILGIFMILIVICIVIQVIDPISAANTKKTIDKGIAPLKNSNLTKMHWEVHDYSNKKVKIYKHYTKNNSKTKYKYTKIKIKKDTNGLTITKVYSGNIPNSKKVIKTKLSPKNYYLKTYKNVLLKNVKLKKKLDNGGEPVVNLPHGHISWKTNIYYNKKIAISENINNLHGKANKKTMIEKYGKNKLKITIKTLYTSYVVSTTDKDNNNPSKSKTVTYVKTKLNPKNYYFNVHKPKMLKHVSKNQEIETAYGLLKESKTKFHWTAKSHMNKNFIKNKVSIIRGFSSNNLTYDKIIITKTKSNELKITHEINGTKKISYVNTKLSPVDYYNVYREKMIEIVNKSTITQIHTIC